MNKNMFDAFIINMLNIKQLLNKFYEDFKSQFKSITPNVFDITNTFKVSSQDAKFL